MSNFVQRILLKAHPTEFHSKYYSWVIADLCIFVGEDDKYKAIDMAYDIIKKEQWIPLSDLNKSTLIEKKIIESGGDVL